MKSFKCIIFPLLVIIAITSCGGNSEPLPTNAEGILSGEEVIKIKIIVQVSADVARSLNHLDPQTAESEALSEMIKTLGFTLVPMHPGTDDPSLQRYFIVEVLDDKTAQTVIDQLLQTKGIEAAYIKPPDELP